MTKDRGKIRASRKEILFGWWLSIKTVAGITHHARQHGRIFGKAVANVPKYVYLRCTIYRCTRGDGIPCFARVIRAIWRGPRQGEQLEKNYRDRRMVHGGRAYAFSPAIKVDTPRRTRVHALREQEFDPFHPPFQYKSLSTDRFNWSFRSSMISFFQLLIHQTIQYRFFRMDFPSTRKSVFYTTIILSPSKSVFDVLLSTSTRYKNPKFLNDRRNV